MMRVLWLNNLVLPGYASKKGLTASEREGWVSGLFEAVKDAGFSLGIAFPLPQGEGDTQSEIIDGIYYFPFREDLTRPEKYDDKLEDAFAEILFKFKPDIVHIAGTEFPHALAMAREFDTPEKTLLGIQGLCSEIAKMYIRGLPDEVVKSRTFRDMLRDDSIIRQQEKYFQRGEHEERLIRLCGHITGRTAFDKQVTQAIHPEAKYHHMNETLRSSFYEGTWDREKAVSHRIFVAQGDYPVKGLHVMLQAMPKILSKYPDTELVVAGQNIMDKSNAKLSGYAKYLKDLIKQYHLESRITMTGMLNEGGMKQTYLKSAVFACPSLIENSPNALGEAMLLGMGVVASDTGGIPSMLKHGEEGLLVPPGDEKALADAVIEYFDTPEKASSRGERARARALKTHDPETNAKRLLEIYEEITGDACQSGINGVD